MLPSARSEAQYWYLMAAIEEYILHKINVGRYFICHCKFKSRQKPAGENTGFVEYSGSDI